MKMVVSIRAILTYTIGGDSSALRKGGLTEAKHIKSRVVISALVRRKLVSTFPPGAKPIPLEKVNTDFHKLLLFQKEDNQATRKIDSLRQLD
ncbi:MAG TPA: hypothetical protein VJ987_10220 [Anaerolineales bacterium]|nr:hypothetical protein [Anaerolineales bacterium]